MQKINHFQFSIMNKLLIVKFVRISFTFFTEKIQRARQMTKSKKDSCPFCKEEKKRPLNAYMRKRSHGKSFDKICEEAEEEEQTNCCQSSHGKESTSK